MHPSKLFLAACAALALVPATASAATISVDADGALHYRGEGTEGNSLLLSAREGENRQLEWYSFSDYGADRIVNQAGDLCRFPEGESGIVLCKRDLTRKIVIDGSDAKDSLSIFSDESVPGSVPVEIRGNGGDDHLKDAYDSNASRKLDGGAGNDKLEAYLGNDLLLGGDGNDELDGGEGNDELRAGNGDDVLAGDKYKSPGADVIDGGAGTDQVEEWNDPAANTHPQPNVSLDGQANDGRPGEGDNVIDVEKFTSHVSIVFSGGDAGETVDVSTPSDEVPSSLTGGGGNDVLTSYDFDDKVDGGTGDDRLFGGFGNDTIVGGPGKDTIYGDQTSSYCGYYTCKIPFGNDTIDAADGEADQVDCGVGEDTAKVDAIDTVVNCEKVEKAGTVAGPEGQQQGPANNGPAVAKLAVVGKAARSALKAGKLALALDCAGACRITVTATVGQKTAKKLGLKTRTLATGSKTMLGAGKAKVTLKLAKAAKKRLSKVRGKLAVAVKVTVTDAAGAKQTMTKQLSLK